MKKILIILFIFIYGYMNAQNVTLYNNVNANFDPQNRVSTVAKIGDDIWVGEDIAINKFDGTTWERYIYTDINCPWQYLWVYSIQEDNDGNIWAAGGGGIHKYDGENWTYYGSSTPGIVPNTDQFNDMVITNDNKMIVVGGNTVWSWIYSVDLATMTFTYFGRDDYPILDDIIQDIYINNSNEVILAAAEGGLVEFDGTDFIAHEAVINFEICSDDEGNYWTGGWSTSQPNALFSYNSDFEEVKELTTENSYLPFPKIFRCAYNNYVDSEIWFRAAELVLESGVVSIYNQDKDYFQVLDEESGLPGTKVSSFLFEDNIYWLAIENTGVVKIDLNDSPFLALESGNIEFEVTAGAIQEVELPILNSGAGELSYDMILAESESWLDVDNYGGAFTGNSGFHTLLIDVTEITEPTTITSPLKIKSNGGHIKFDITIDVKISSGVENMGRENAIYPNPTDDILNIGSTEGLDEINVYNFCGQLVYSQNSFQNSQISISSLQKGQYIVELKYSDRAIKTKVLKM